MRLHELTLRARLVFPVDAPPIESGTVRIAGERIVAVERGQSHVDIDLGNTAIVPGFVNAHTHLELSSLRAKELGGGHFVRWLTRVVAARASQTPAEIAHAVARGIDATLAVGTTLVGDISTSGRSWKELMRSPLRAVVFAELLGLKSDRAVQTANAARQFLEWTNPGAPHEVNAVHSEITSDQASASLVFPDGTLLDALPPGAPARATRRLLPSLSPHAPYSTHVLLYDWAAKWGHQARVPLSTHVAETEEESQLLRHRAGSLREFLGSIGAWSDDWQPSGPSPADYIGRHGYRPDWLLAHGNYFEDEEIRRLADGAGPRCAIVYCPRTHHYFGHRPHPYPKMLAAGLPVCLGTDSLASTPSLSVLDEMRFLHRRDPSLNGATLLHLGTLAGARALGRGQDCGSLAPGKFADLAVVRLPARDANDPHELLFDSADPVMRTMIGGRVVFERR